MCEVFGFGCSETASCRPSPGRSPIKLGWVDTLDAEYVALTQLQADALITLNPDLASAAKDLVTVAPIDVLT